MMKWQIVMGEVLCRVCSILQCRGSTKGWLSKPLTPIYSTIFYSNINAYGKNLGCRPDC